MKQTKSAQGYAANVDRVLVLLFSFNSSHNSPEQNEAEGSAEVSF